MNDTVIHNEKLADLKAKIEKYKSFKDVKHLTGSLNFEEKKQRRKLRKFIFKTIMQL